MFSFSLSSIHSIRILHFVVPSNDAILCVYRKPSANILKSEAIKDHVAPQVASFSSRGPNPIISDILKVGIIVFFFYIFFTFHFAHIWIK